ncbi:chemotaxis protein CheB [Flavisolibacter ginsengisoli]|jgi:two-component system chemotaxis response regulator CheB|uniref:protein-glutamate methylesterase n=1 Tax=Flavisolibacter ginsengisoli DSM 18119 TaxID=1121884 RepID=A0A1M4TXM9_9BACT|nr:chemotaxis protein CheB [Flavisolibacter ginsengisoli]SHE49215.1 two-component system, chemotaxis family, response regulator CheB [Flavisolibacter ginsengisoli DSM 18119]
MEKEIFMNKYELLIIGGSAGGLEVLLEVLPQLRTDLDYAVVLVMHRRGGDSLLTGLLSDKTKLAVKEAEEKEAIRPGVIYIAPADYHLLIENDKTFSLDYSEKIHYSRPAIDASFETAAEAYGPLLAGVLLSGANADGAEGLLQIKQAGGLTIVQDPDEASVSYMPQQAIEKNAADKILTTRQIIGLLNELNHSIKPGNR